MELKQDFPQQSSGDQGQPSCWCVCGPRGFGAATDTPWSIPTLTGYVLLFSPHSQKGRMIQFLFGQPHVSRETNSLFDSCCRKKCNMFKFIQIHLKHIKICRAVYSAFVVEVYRKIFLLFKCSKCKCLCVLCFSLCTI